MLSANMTVFALLGLNNCSNFVEASHFAFPFVFVVPLCACVRSYSFLTIDVFVLEVDCTIYVFAVCLFNKDSMTTIVHWQSVVPR